MRHIGPPGLEISHENVDEHTVVVRALGEIDMDTAPRLQQRINSLTMNGTMTLVVDLDRIDFIDTSGLHLLLEAHQRMTAKGGRALVMCGPRVARVVRLAGLQDTLLSASGLWAEAA